MVVVHHVDTAFELIVSFHLNDSIQLFLVEFLEGHELIFTNFFIFGKVELFLLLLKPFLRCLVVFSFSIFKLGAVAKYLHVLLKCFRNERLLLI